MQGGRPVARHELMAADASGGNGACGCVRFSLHPLPVSRGSCLVQERTLKDPQSFAVCGDSTVKLFVDTSRQNPASDECRPQWSRGKSG